MSRSITALAAVAVAVLPVVAAAQSQKDELKRFVSLQLESSVQSPGDVISKLAQLKPDGAISRGFNVGAVTTRLFGRNLPSAAPDCRTTTTANKEPDEGLCILERGSRDDPKGEYTTLAYSKNIGMGNVLFAHRPKFDLGQADPPATKVTPDDAMKMALEFMALVGVPKSEIPIAPSNAKNPLPVRTLWGGYEADPQKEAKRIPLQQVVALPRAFQVPGGLHVVNGVMVTHVRAPGSALIAIDDGGIQYASVDGWSDAQIAPVERALAKSLDELATEITEDLWNEGVRKVGSMSMVVSLRRAYPNPDDPNPPLCPVCGLLLPAVQVTISQAGPGRVETSEKSFVAPGLVREYDLARQAEGRAAR